MKEGSANWWLRWSLALPALGLVAAVVLQGVPVVRAEREARRPDLTHAIPAAAAGWSERDVPLGPSEFLSTEVEKVLNYDEVVNREFSRSGESFGVYVAYWSSGKMPTQVVASHTPDRCWTENGWHCASMKFNQRLNFAGVPLQPAEWRVFEPPESGRPTYVLYWLLVGGHAYDYGERFSSIPDPVLWWKEAVRQALMGSREQYFVRLTSSEPFENLWNDQGFAAVLGSLARLGLAPKPSATSNKL